MLPIYILKSLILLIFFKFLFIERYGSVHILGVVARKKAWKTQVSFSDHLSSISPSVCFSHFHNQWANFNQTFHKASLGEGIQISSNKGHSHFQGGDNYEIAKKNWQNLKIFLRTTKPISTKLGTMHLWWRRKRGWSFSSPNQRYEIITALSKCVYWFKQVSQVSDVAHGPLVLAY